MNIIIIICIIIIIIYTIIILYMLFNTPKNKCDVCPPSKNYIGIQWDSQNKDVIDIMNTFNTFLSNYQTINCKYIKSLMKKERDVFITTMKNISSNIGSCKSIFQYIDSENSAAMYFDLSPMSPEDTLVVMKNVRAILTSVIKASCDNDHVNQDKVILISDALINSMCP